MRLACFSLSLCCLASSAVAFSVVATPKMYGKDVVSGNKQNLRRNFDSALGVSSADSISTAAMERGVGGRIEAAFETAKQRGEAAFVTFITAGYPNSKGRFLRHLLLYSLLESFPNLSYTRFRNRYSCIIDGHAGRWCFHDRAWYSLH